MGKVDRPRGEDLTADAGRRLKGLEVPAHALHARTRICAWSIEKIRENRISREFACIPPFCRA